MPSGACKNFISFFADNHNLFWLPDQKWVFGQPCCIPAPTMYTLLTPDTSTATVPEAPERYTAPVPALVTVTAGRVPVSSTVPVLHTREGVRQMTVDRPANISQLLISAVLRSQSTHLVLPQAMLCIKQAELETISHLTKQVCPGNEAKTEGRRRSIAEEEGSKC